MKKVLILLFVAICILSCSKTKEDRIKDKFKEYVYKNFDNPKCLNEIVSVEPYDTLTYEKIKNVVSLLFDLADQTDSLRKIELKMLVLTASDIANNLYQGYQGEYRRKIYLNFTKECLDILEEQRDWEILYASELGELKIRIDSLLEENKSLLLYEYLIKARVKEHDELKLKTYYVLEDSISTNFFTEKPTFENYPTKTFELYKASRKYEDIYMIKRNSIQKGFDISKKYRMLLDL